MKVRALNLKYKRRKIHDQLEQKKHYSWGKKHISTLSKRFDQQEELEYI